MQILNTTLTKADGNGSIFLNGTLGLVARVVRIRPYSWSKNPPCMRLELYGCQADPGMYTGQLNDLNVNGFDRFIA